MPFDKSFDMSISRILSAVVVMVVILLLWPIRFGSQETDVNAAMAEAARRINLTQLRDAEMRLMQATSDGPRLTATYQLLREKAEEVNWNAFHSHFSGTLAAKCHHKQTVPLMNMGGEMQFDYIDRNNVLVARYVLNKHNCNAHTSRIAPQNIPLAIARTAPPAPGVQGPLSRREQIEQAIFAIAPPLLREPGARTDLIAGTEAYLQQGMNLQSAAKLAVADYEQAHPRH